MSRRSLLVVLCSVCSSCVGDLETTPISVGPHRLEPASAVFGRTRYEKDGPLFVDQKYDVTWVVVSDRPELCAAFAATAVCVGDEPAAPAWPDGLHFELLFNSFAESDGADIGESTHTYSAQFRSVEDGGTILFEEATGGSIRSLSVDETRARGRYRASSDGGMDLNGSFDAEACPEMNDILWKRLYKRSRCP